MFVFGGKYNPENIIFNSDEDREQLIKDISNNGIFFICSHIGNIEVMRCLTDYKEYSVCKSVSIFLQANQCKIFSEFINKISQGNNKLKIYPVEEIGINTAIELEENIKNNGICFMAGDRISAGNPQKTAIVTLLNKKIEIPTGVFKMAQIMNTEICFVSCIKEKNKYRVFMKKPSAISDINTIQKEYAQFLESMILKSPYQFYHFYDYFI